MTIEWVSFERALEHIASCRVADCQRQLMRRLWDGEVAARCALFRSESATKLDSWLGGLIEVENEVFGSGIEPRYGGQAGPPPRQYSEFLIPREFWTQAKVEWVLRDGTNSRRYDASLKPYLADEWLPGHVLDTRQRHVAIDIQISAAELLRIWPGRLLGTIVAEAAEKPRGGRPPIGDYAAWKELLKVEIENVGLPDRNAPPGWRTTEDVIRFLVEQIGASEKLPEHRTMQNVVKRLLKEIKDETHPKSVS